MATEKRLVEADKLLQEAHWVIRSDGTRAFVVHAEDIENAPTVDAVEVVRCKECVCYEETCPGYGYCYHWDYEQGMSPIQVESDDFCSYGERRNNGTESEA